MRNGFRATSKGDTLPNISSSDKLIVKKVAFEDGIQSVMEANHKEEKDAVLRLPNIHDSATIMSLEDDRQFDDNSHKNDFSGLDNVRGTESHLSKKVDVKEKLKTTNSNAIYDIHNARKNYRERNILISRVFLLSSP